MSIDALSDEEWTARSIQGIRSLPTPLFVPTLPIPGGLSPISTLAPSSAEAEEARQRPEIPLPTKSAMRRLLDAHMETERLTSKGAALFDADIARSREEIDKLDQERQESLVREAEAAKSRATWDTLSNVAQYVASISSIGLGWAAGGPAGGLLMASGAIGLGVRVAKDTHLLEKAVAWYTESEELQRKITNNIEMGAFFLQMGLGLAGGAWAWRTGALAAARVGSLQNTTKVLTTASGVISGAAKVGSDIYTKKITDIKARMKEVDGQMTNHQQNIEQDCKTAGRMLQTTESVGDELRKAIQSIQIN